MAAVAQFEMYAGNEVMCRFDRVRVCACVPFRWVHSCSWEATHRSLVDSCSLRRSPSSPGERGACARSCSARLSAPFVWVTSDGATIYDFNDNSTVSNSIAVSWVCVRTA
jgi:hypothetical protein